MKIIGNEMMADEKVLVCPVEDFTFEEAKNENYYAFPESYRRNVPQFIAFYRIKPISAVTHFSEIEEVEVTNQIKGKYKLMVFGDHFDEKAVVVHLKGLKKLDSPVKRNNYPFQGSLITTVSKLKKASVVSEL